MTVKQVYKDQERKDMTYEFYILPGCPFVIKAIGSHSQAWETQGLHILEESSLHLNPVNRKINQNRSRGELRIFKKLLKMSFEWF